MPLKASAGNTPFQQLKGFLLPSTAIGYSAILPMDPTKETEPGFTTGNSPAIFPAHAPVIPLSPATHDLTPGTDTMVPSGPGGVPPPDAHRLSPTYTFFSSPKYSLNSAPGVFALGSFGKDQEAIWQTDPSGAAGRVNHFLRSCPIQRPPAPCRR